MRILIEFTLDPEIKLNENLQCIFESDVRVLVDSYSTRDGARISYEEDYVPNLETKTHFGDDMSELIKRQEITEEEYNDLFQQDRADQNKEVDDEMNRRHDEYGNKDYERPIDP